MATAILDTLTTMQQDEDQGAVVYIKRSILVTGLVDTDFQVLQSALDTAGVPAIGSVPTGYENVVLARRRATIIPNEKTKAIVEIEYIPKRDSVLASVAQFRGGSSLTQATIERDRFGQQITVTHTFPAGHEKYPSEEVTKGTTVDVLHPQHAMHIRVILARDYPQFLSAEWTGYTNSVRWSGGGVRKWLCDVPFWEPHDMSASPKEWIFTFNFNFDSRGYLARKVFIDETTGDPPPNLVEGLGMGNVTWHPSRDFNELFPAADVILAT